MNIDHPGKEQEASLRRLWKTVFGDSEEFLDSFFGLAYSPRRCRCATENGELAGALYWFDTECNGSKFAYLYAVATDPAFRNRGVCRALLADTAELLRVQGYAGELLVPEGEALARMYEKMGYLPCTTVTEFTCRAAGEPAAMDRIGGAAYARLRRELLQPGGVVQEGAALALLGDRGAFYAGKGWIAAVERDGDKLRCHELLGDPQAAPGILRALGCREGFFRIPGDGKPFGWHRPLTADCPVPAYFGLALD